jgi:D-alanyl-D-alanine carboxypeptidase
MNNKAKVILMPDTSFVDPHGLSSDNVSTAQDLYYLARYILNNRPPLLKITRGEKVTSFGGITFENLTNKNLFFEDPNFIGGKTGYITASHHTGIFIFSFKKGDIERHIVTIVLGAVKSKENPDNIEGDIIKIQDWIGKNYFSS